MNKDRDIIPLASISNYFPIEIASPPPHRTKLDVDQDALISALLASNTRRDRLRIAFVRNEPKVDIAPQNPGEIAEITAHAKSTSDKPIPSAVAINRTSGVIYLRIPYKDHETRVPEETAKTTTKGFHKALSSVPKEKYKHLWHTKDISLDAETAVFTAKLLATIASPALSVAAINLTNIVTNSHLESGAVNVFMPAFAYSYVSFLSLLDAYMYRKGTLRVNKIRERFAQMCAKDPRMALYPTMLVHELLVPSFLYSLRTMNKDIFVVK
jgi:hypothetical protein